MSNGATTLNTLGVAAEEYGTTILNMLVIAAEKYGVTALNTLVWVNTLGSMDLQLSTC